MSKEEQRAILRWRLSVNPQDHEGFSRQIITILESLSFIQQAKTIMTFAPMKNEPQIQPFNEALRQAGHIVAYPKCENGEIRAYYSLSNTYVKGRYGILEPSTHQALMLEPEAFEVILVPCVGFDVQGHRLGHGAGYYDRFLSRSKALKIGVAFSKQKLSVIETETHDVLLDDVVCDTGLIDCRAKRAENQR